MNLNQIKRPYDMIVSLGWNCQTAFQLKRKKLRSFTGPIDWMYSYSVSHLCRLLKQKFNGFMEVENMRIEGIQGTNSCYTVSDLNTKCVSVHDFLVTENSDTSLLTYPQFKEKMNRRIEKLYNSLAISDSALFVRIQANRDEALELKNAISEIYHGDFSILIINYTKEEKVIEIDWAIDRVCAVEIPNSVNAWTGCNSAWDTILEGVTLSKGSD